MSMYSVIFFKVDNNKGKKAACLEKQWDGISPLPIGFGATLMVDQSDGSVLLTMPEEEAAIDLANPGSVYFNAKPVDGIESLMGTVVWLGYETSVMNLFLVAKSSVLNLKGPNEWDYTKLMVQFTTIVKIN